MNAVGDCVECGYPLSVSVGKQISCPACSTINKAVSVDETGTVGVPTPIVAGLIGVAVGIVFSQAVLKGASRGVEYLGRKAGG